MVRLSLKGYFIADLEDKPILDYYFKGRYYKKGKSYIIPGNAEVYRKILMHFPDNIIDPTCYLYPILESQNISSRTKKLYFQINKKFIEFARKKPEDITEQNVNAYLEHLKKKKRRASTIKTVYMGIRLFFEKLLGVIDLEDVELPELEEPDVDILSRKEIKSIIFNINSAKHQLIIKMAYGCGLKLSEVVNIKIKDIDFDNKLLRIRGRNKRVIPLSEDLLEEIRNYIHNYHIPEGKNSPYLFFSQKPGKPISTRSVEIMFKKSLSKAGLKVSLRFSVLRDSFIVHLIDKGYCLDTVSELTGMKESQILKKFGIRIKMVKKNRIPQLLDLSDVA